MTHSPLAIRVMHSNQEVLTQQLLIEKTLKAKQDAERCAKEMEDTIRQIELGQNNEEYVKYWKLTRNVGNSGS